MSRMLRNTVRLKNDLSNLAREAMELERQENSRNVKEGENGIDSSEGSDESQRGEARKKVLSQFVSRRADRHWKILEIFD